MLDTYITINKSGYAETVEKKSKFIAVAQPVETQEEALSFIDEIKLKHKTATHNVSAFTVIDLHQKMPGVERYSDDGEPSQTAGKPILELLNGENVKNAVIVVTRYFGGTLLGTGGLVRAYGHSAKLALLDAKIVTKLLCEKLALTISYEELGRVQHAILKNNHITTDTQYTDVVKLFLKIKTQEVEGFIKQMRDMTNGGCELERLGFEYLCI